MGENTNSNLKAEGKPKEGVRRHIRKGGGTLIIAVDFDGILCEDKFPLIGNPNQEVIYIVKQLITAGHEVILWTSRTDTELEVAKQWCADRGLNFTSINENAPSNIEKYKSKYPNGTRKIYADIYIDDHDIDCQLYLKNYGYDIMLTHIADLLKEVLRNER